MTKGNKPYRVIISGGGTGGHVYPAIAIANELRATLPAVDILFIGALGKMEMNKVPEAGYEIIGLWISGIARKLTLKNLLFPIKLIVSLLKARSIVKKFKPDVVVGTGGYASGPTVMAANASKIPVLIQEQNSYPGITNRQLSKKAVKVCVAYPGMDKFFEKEKVVFTGNPVRSDINTLDNKKEEAQKYFNLNPTKKTILIIGGSLGARTINDAVIENISEMTGSGVQVIWQSGKFYFDEMKSKLGDTYDWMHLTMFIDRMDLAYAAADIVVSRAGALSISELCVAEKPSILVPSPNVAENHQEKNAMTLVSENAAIMIKDSEANAKLIPAAIDLLKDELRMSELSKNIKALGKPNAAKEICHELLNIIR